jgi:hypothetical protein
MGEVEVIDVNKSTTTRIILHVKTTAPQSSDTRVQRRKTENKGEMKKFNGIGGSELDARGRGKVGVILLLDGKEVKWDRCVCRVCP